MNEGIGIKLKAMEFYKCASQGLIAPSEPNQIRSPMSLMLVLVESLQGQSKLFIQYKGLSKIYIYI